MIHLDNDFEFDSYKVSSLLKEGIYNDTYRVRDANDTSYFMKIYDLEKVPKSLLCDNQEICEINYCKKIHHKNIISFINEGKIVIDNVTYPYMITDYFSGELLADKLNRVPKLTLDESMMYINGVLDGLEYLHGIELVHNDITPRNIMFDTTSEGEIVAKIIDMGHTSPRAAGEYNFITKDLETFYRAPETFAGIFEYVSDVYSAAAVLYTMLTGNAPWFFDIAEKGNDMSKVKLALKSKRKTELLVFDDDGHIPECVKNAIIATLTSTCDNRYTIVDFRKALKGEIVAGNKKSIHPETPFVQQSHEENAEKQETGECEVDVKKGKGHGFEDIAGMQGLKDMLTKKVIMVLKDKERAKKYKLTPPNGMLLYGPPGCGKSFFAEKFAEESGFNFIMVKASDLASIYIHGTQGKIAELFKKAESQAPIVICFDEFDALVPNRSAVDSQSFSGEVNEFLTELNNCSQKGVFVIGTSNRPDKIDPAVLRTGRIDKLVYVPLPDETARREMFRLHLKDRPCGEIDYDCLAKATDKYVASDIAYIVNDAAMTSAFLDEPITNERLMDSVKYTRPSLTGSTLRQYEEIKDRLEGVDRKIMPHIGFK